MLFFELLQIAIGNRSELSRVPAVDEWQEIFSLSQKQALTGVAFLGVERLPQELCPPKELLMQWFVATEQIKTMNATIDRQVVTVAEHFKKDGFRSVVLKGQGMARLYEDGRYRTPGDIDIWLEGSRADIVGYVRRRCPDCDVVYHHVDFLPIGKTEVEVHFTPSWMNSPVTNRRLQRWFRSFNFHFPTNNSSELPVPSLAFNRVYILVHIYRHLFHEGIGLRQFLDYYYVLCQGITEEERMKTMDVLCSLGMRRFAGAAMWVLQMVFGMDDRYLLTSPDEHEGRFLLDEIMLAGNFGKYDERLQHMRGKNILLWGLHKVIRNFRFVRSYPSEVLWSPLFKIWHYFWRKCI